MKLSEIVHGKISRPNRIIICGVERIGKTTWACGSPEPILIPIKGEEGSDDFDVARFPVANTFNDVIGAIESLCEEEHKFETVVIDSLSTLEPLIWDSVCKDENVASIEKVGGGFGKGYVEAVSRWRDLMAGLDYLRSKKNMGCILIAHVVIKTFSDPTGDTYDTYEIDMNKKATSALLRWSDAILFANCKTVTKTEKTGTKETKKGIMRNERVLFTQKRPSHPGGGRGILGHLPYELDMSYGAWVRAIEEATAGKDK